MYTSVHYSLRGFKAAWGDKSFRMEVWGCVLIMGIIWWLWPLTTLELFILMISYGIVLITELLNTALEEALDHLHPTHHEKVGRSKDIASSAVMISLILLIAAISSIVVSHLKNH